MALEYWDREAAEVAHHEGRLYTVLVGSRDNPTNFIEVTSGAITVGFLDNHLREKMTYGFQLTSDGTLFLSMATYREFSGNSDTISSGTTYIFNEEGRVSIIAETFDPHFREESTSAVEIQGNYSRYPDFGEYGDLVKIER